MSCSLSRQQFALFCGITVLKVLGFGVQARVQVLGLPEPYFLYMHHACQSVSREAAIRETRVNYAQPDKLGNVPGDKHKKTHHNYSSDKIYDGNPYIPVLLDSKPKASWHQAS